jgi:Domain of unknown function (DUF4157)
MKPAGAVTQTVANIQSPAVTRRPPPDRASCTAGRARPSMVPLLDRADSSVAKAHIPASVTPGTLQAKLEIGAVNDPLEREADRVADDVMNMPHTAGIGAVAPRLSRKCEACEEEDQKVQPARARGAIQAPGEVPDSVNRGLRSPGQALDSRTRALFEPRFGRSFDHVRIHTDASAAASARGISALAYTVGSDIVFADRRYDPRTSAGGRLLAHELAHTVQQSGATPTVQRTSASCPKGWDATVQADHQRALGMIDTATTKLSAYDGTNPPEVKAALEKHFKASGTGLAAQIKRNLGSISALAASLASYDCEDTSSWWCNDPGTLAKTFWCVPGVDIRVCQPLYFALPDMDRSATLIHEWFHKYGCNFDLGYQDDPGYPKQGTLTALFNADPFAQFVRDVQTSAGTTSPSAPAPAPSGSGTGTGSGGGAVGDSGSGGGIGSGGGVGSGSGGGTVGDSGSSSGG